jgi:hypothetical protein
MTPSPADPDSISPSQFAALNRSLRFLTATCIVALSYPNIRLAVSIGQIQRFYRHMLGNKPLPPIAQFVIDYSWLFVLAAIILPLASIALVFTRQAARSIYLCVGIIFALFCVTVLEWEALLVTMNSPLLRHGWR